jgi:hypothetical protein
MTQPQPLESQPTSLPDLKNGREPAPTDGAVRRPWTVPNVQALDLSTARANGCRAAIDNGSC